MYEAGHSDVKAVREFFKE